MHPSIRILSCIAFILFVSQSGWLQLLLFAAVLCLAVVIQGRETVISSMKMQWRLRWLFLSILILASWFTPGEALLPEYNSWSPTYEGLAFGLQRLAILAEIIMAVNLLVLSSSTAEMVAALQWLFGPLKLFGISVDKFSLRMALTLQEVRKPAIDIAALVAASKGERPIKRVVVVVSEAYRQSLQPGEQLTTPAPAFYQPTSPVLAQWLLFSGFIALLFSTQWLL